MSLLAPIKKARGLGSAKAGVHHWWMQRVTAICPRSPHPLGGFSLIASHTGQSYEDVQTWLSKPFTTAMFTLFVFTSFYHAALGLQVIIEDYR